MKGFGRYKCMITIWLCRKHSFDSGMVSCLKTVKQRLLEIMAGAKQKLNLK